MTDTPPQRYTFVCPNCKCTQLHQNNFNMMSKGTVLAIQEQHVSPTQTYWTTKIDENVFEKESEWICTSCDKEWNDLDALKQEGGLIPIQ